MFPQILEDKLRGEEPQFSGPGLKTLPLCRPLLFTGPQPPNMKTRTTLQLLSYTCFLSSARTLLHWWQLQPRTLPSALKIRTDEQPADKEGGYHPHRCSSQWGSGLRGHKTVAPASLDQKGQDRWPRDKHGLALTGSARSPDSLTSRTCPHCTCPAWDSD